MIELMIQVALFSYIFCLGAVIGSFLNVVICRLPQGQSLVTPPSHCPSCIQELRWYQLIPILSYVMLRGRCGTCQEQIGIKYPMIEALTGLLFMLVFYQLGFQWLTVAYWLLFAILIPICFIDLEHLIIPDSLNLAIFILGIGVSLGGLSLSLGQAILGSMVGGGILLSLGIVSKGGMGGGDIKFAFAIGLFTGWPNMLLLLFLASLLGTCFGLVIWVKEGYQRGRLIPFGPYLVVAAMMVLLWGDQLIQAYLGIF